jgi:hypothetical protein
MDVALAINLATDLPEQIIKKSDSTSFVSEMESPCLHVQRAYSFVSAISLWINLRSPWLPVHL